jgi:glucuronoarabinoxylan endo-1,4-beta-xylanase
VSRGGLAAWVVAAALAAWVTAALAPAAALAGAASAVSDHDASDGANVVVSDQQAQSIDGFGFSEAFGQVQNIQALSQTDQQAVARLLFSPSSGAGLNIVRFGLGGAGSPDDQLWLGREALHYGVHNFYADSWSAPAEMKTNGSQDNGGYLCGVPGESCASGDHRQAYADLLAAQASEFARRGLPLRAMGFVNEPDFTAPYASMLMTPEQAADFAPYLGAALRAQGLATRVACCDAEGWQDAAQFAQTVLASPDSARSVGLITGHGYTAAPTFPLTSERPVWETEWATFQPWDPAWDDGSTASGLSWANNIFNALTSADVNGFLYWWGASTSGEGGVDNEGLINISGGTYQPSGRLWAFAGFSRFIAPGAVRLETTSAVNGLLTVAFHGSGGTVLVVINNNDQAVPMSARLDGVPSDGHATPYVTDANETVAAQAPVPVSGGRLESSVPARSMVTYQLGSEQPVLGEERP